LIAQTYEVSGARFAFTDRWGGESAVPYERLNLGGAVGDDPARVAANRELAAKSLDLDPSHVVWMSQVHGDQVAVVDAPWGDAVVPAVDALVTTRPGLALAVLAADCVPVLLADPVAGVAGAAHAGRQGMVAGVVPAVVAEMARQGADPSRITAFTGPAVCGRCYEVPEAMREQACGIVPEAYATTSWGTPSLDIVAGVHAQLARLGVRASEKSHVCTMESADHFSYRRDGRTGRLGSYVWLTDAQAAGR
jgi:polyphenol oxidase